MNLESVSAASATASQPPQSPVTVVICDSNLESANALARALRRAPGVEVVGVTTTGEEAERLVRDQVPDVVLVGLDGRGSDAIQIARRIRFASPTARVAMLTRSASGRHLYDAIRAGSSGYINRRNGVAEIATAVRAVGTGTFGVPAHLASTLLHELEGGAISMDATERAILAAAAGGDTGGDPPDDCNATTTVQRRVEGIFSKLHLRQSLDALSAPRAESVPQEQSPTWPATATNLAASAPCPSPIGRGQ